MNQNRPGIGTSVGQSRRRVLQTAVALATMAAVGDYQPAYASRGWCRSDPLIAIDGVLVDIFCTAPLTAPVHVTGPTEIVVRVPVDVTTALIVAGIGFGRGERILFEEWHRLKQTAEGLKFVVDVYVPADRELPIGVEVAPRIVGILDPVRAEGLTNEWITVATHLPIATLLESQSSVSTLLESQSSGSPGRRARDKRSHRRRKGKRIRR